MICLTLALDKMVAILADDIFKRFLLNEKNTNFDLNFTEVRP